MEPNQPYLIHYQPSWLDHICTTVMSALQHFTTHTHTLGEAIKRGGRKGGRVAHRHAVSVLAL